jgi:hypothetical protein
MDGMLVPVDMKGGARGRRPATVGARCESDDALLGAAMSCPKCGRPRPAAEFRPGARTYEYACLWSEDNDDGKPFVWEDPARPLQRPAFSDESSP